MSQIVAEPVAPRASSRMSTTAASTSAFASAVTEVAWAAFVLTLIAGIGALKLLTPFDGD